MNRECIDIDVEPVSRCLACTGSRARAGGGRIVTESERRDPRAAPRAVSLAPLGGGGVALLLSAGD